MSKKIEMMIILKMIILKSSFNFTITQSFSHSSRLFNMVFSEIWSFLGSPLGFNSSVAIIVGVKSIAKKEINNYYFSIPSSIVHRPILTVVSAAAWGGFCVGVANFAAWIIKFAVRTNEFSPVIPLALFISTARPIYRFISKPEKCKSMFPANSRNGGLPNNIPQLLYFLRESAIYSFEETSKQAFGWWWW